MKKEKKTLKNLIDEIIEKIDEDCYHFLILLSPQDVKDLKNCIRQSLIRVAKETIEETRIEGKKMKDIKWNDNDDYWRGFEDAIKLEKEKQLKWMEENL